MKKYDIMVAGGGFAGTAAAIAAARRGAKVILADKSNCLGGAACNALVQPFMPYKTLVNGKRIKLCEGIFGEITNELKKMDNEYECDNESNSNVLFNEEYLKVILNRMAIKAGVDLLFHSYITGVKTQGKKIVSVTLSTKSGNIDVEADYFIDATGDADIAYMSGYGCRLGREEDNLCQPMTLCFRLANVDVKTYQKLPAGYINNLYKKFQKEGRIKNIREDVLIFKNPVEGVLHFNSTRIVKRNPVDVFDVTKAEIEAREQVMELYLFMKNNIPGFENSRLLMTASEIGIRESRMIEGEYILTGEDLKACRKFDDAIALGNYDIDIHNPEGSGTSHYFFKDGEFYTIPYRSLIPKDSENLLAAGRNISVDHYAQASIRIMPIVCCIGEAAGAAAAIAAENKCGVRDINIEELKNSLRKNGARIEI